jgi:hypothetical protein
MVKASLREPVFGESGEKVNAAADEVLNQFRAQP